MALEAFPLHLLVWNNQYLELDRELQKNEVHFNGIFITFLQCFLLLDEPPGQSAPEVSDCIK